MIDYSEQKENKVSWGTDSSYFGLNLRPAYLEAEDIAVIQHLTPSERVEWLLMMQRLIIKQFHVEEFIARQVAIK